MTCRGQIKNRKSTVHQYNVRINIYPYPAIIRPTMSDAFTHKRRQSIGPVRTQAVYLQKSG